MMSVATCLPCDRRRAFSLVELLVVVSILALLLALLMPSLQMARTLARDSVCRSNLSQLNRAHSAYMVNSKGDFFPYNGSIIYMAFLEKYHTVHEIRLCPQADKPFYPNTAARGGSRNAWQAWSRRGSYGVNGWIYNPTDAATNYNAGGRAYPCCKNRPFPGSWWQGIGDTGYPALTPSYADSNWVDGWPWWDDIVPPVLDGSITDPNEKFQMSRFCFDRHRLAINVGFLDGHVDRVPLGQLWTLLWSKLHEPSERQIP